MTNRDKFSSARLRLARNRRGLTKVALGDVVELSARRIAAYENQGELPPESTVQSLAEALKFPVEFFYQGDPPAVDNGEVSFRSFSRLPASRRDAALAAATLAIELDAWLSERFELPSRNVPDFREVDPGTAALGVRTLWGLGEAPAPNLIHLLEANGARVYSLVDDCAALDGFSMWHDTVPYVFLTHHKSPERGRWDASHELGHLVLHVGSPPQGRESERDADLFAAEFLLPEAGVRASAPRSPSLNDIRSEKVKWGVSVLAYVRRLHQLELTTDRRYRSLVIEATQAGYRRAEGDIDRERSQLVPKIMRMLREDGIDVGDLARQLALSNQDLRGLLFSALTSVEGGTSHSSPRTREHLKAL